MLDFTAIRSVTLDVADTYEDADLQDQAAEVIWRLLERNYHIFLVSTNPDRSLEREDFEHPQLEMVRAPMPPKPATAQAYPALFTASNLWVTDDETLAEWAVEAGLPLATRLDLPLADGARVARIAGPSELDALLDRTIALLHDIERRLAGMQTLGARVIGLGGPPLSGFPELALRLKHHLERAGYPLVELLNLGAVMRGSAATEEGAAGAGPWVSPEVGRWVAESLLVPARAGETIYLERLPEGVPEAFEPHLPLYLTPESVVLAFGEMPFRSELRPLFDLTILLETTPEETTRRIYEIDESGFDAKFTEQYLTHEGRVYRRYLEDEAVPAWVDLRVDANTPDVFTLAADAGAGKSRPS